MMRNCTKVRQWFKQWNTIIITTNINCGIVTVKLNHNITGNLPIEMVYKIVSLMYEFQHQLKFQPVLRKIEDGTMCVLQVPIFHFFRRGVYPLYVDSRMFNRWASRMHPKYENYERYEGPSRYLTPFDVICNSKKFRKQCKQCKY